MIKPSFKRYPWLTLIVALSLEASLYAAERPLSVEILVPKAPSPYPALLHVKFINLNYAHLDLGQLYSSSTINMDGQPIKRVSEYWGGSTSISPGSTWEGCLNFTDYASTPTEGAHTVTLTFGDEVSNKIKIQWTTPLSSATLSDDDRFHHAQALAVAVRPGLPRSCVEQWLPDRDGGIQPEEATRYYLGHGIKVRIPYSVEPRPDDVRNAVNGKGQVYREERIEN
jgi:hypothetical protein